VYDQDRVRVTAFEVTQANLKDAFGFRVDYRRHAVVISGEMTLNENFVKYAQGADVIIHRVGVARPELLERDPGVRHMLGTHHSSPEDAARDFARNWLFIPYTRPRREDIPEVSTAEILPRTRAIYPGPLETGEDLMSISIGNSVTVERHSQ
jgi:ribonuclease Z